VAATVIQWLGTACGGGFLRECERQIKQLTDAEQKEKMRLWKAEQESKFSLSEE